MSYKILKEPEGSNKEPTKKQRVLKVLAKIPFQVYLFSVVGFIMLGTLAYVYHQSETERKELESKFARKAPDYESLEAVQTADETTSSTEGAISLDEYTEVSVAKIADEFANIEDVLGTDLYVSIINGVTTDYFQKSMEYDYEDFKNQVDDMLVEAQYINQLYGRYQLDHPGELVEFTGCTTGETCEMKEFIDTYTTGDLKDYLNDAHTKWESLVYYEREQQEIDDSYLNMFYQDYVVGNFDYISKYDVSFIVLSPEQFSLKFSELQDAFDKGAIPVTRLTNYTDVKPAKNETIVPSRKALESFPLYKDINFYDGTFKDLAADTIQAFFVQSVMDSSTYLGGDELSGDNEALVDAIKEISDGGELSGTKIQITGEDGSQVYESATPSEATEEKDLFNLDMSQLENWQVMQASLTNRSEEDVIFILWRINRIEHTLDIPDMNSLREELTLKAKTQLAQQKVGAIIYAELNQLSDEETEQYVESLFGAHSTVPSSSEDTTESNAEDTTEDVTNSETEQ